jgi:hypothetical protein
VKNRSQEEKDATVRTGGVCTKVDAICVPPAVTSKFSRKQARFQLCSLS